MGAGVGSARRKARVQVTNDDIQVERCGDAGVTVVMWGSRMVLGRNDAFDLLDKLRRACGLIIKGETDSVSTGQEKER